MAYRDQRDGKRPRSIYTKIQSSNQSIVSFLKSNGIADAEISVNPPSVYDNFADRYSTQNLTYRYQVTNVVVVTSDKVELVRELIKSRPNCSDRE